MKEKGDFIRSVEFREEFNGYESEFGFNSVYIWGSEGSLSPHSDNDVRDVDFRF